jgi:hypothetical protein
MPFFLPFILFCHPSFYLACFLLAKLLVLLHAVLPLHLRAVSGILSDKSCKIYSRVADQDPDSIGSVDPDPESESGSWSRRAKMTHKSRQKFVKVHVSVGWPLLRAEGFFCNLDILYGGLGIG